MASPNSELSLDCKPHSSSSSYSMLLKSFGDQADQTQKLEEILAHLEEERFKIDGLKRELPLCMQLLSNAMEASRQQLQAYRANHHDHHHQGATITKPVLEEFMPLKLNSSTPSENNPDQSPNRIPDNKANWMTTAQLWSPTGAANNNETILPHNTIAAAAAAGNAKESSAHDDEDHRHLHHAGFKLSLDSKQRINNGGAFLPFSKERNSPTTTLRDFPDLALASSDHNKNNMDHHHHHDQENENKVTSNENIHHQVHQVNGGGGNASEIRQTNNSINNNNNSSHRKARRCWSPDLHRRFVNALQMLGGSQVATPKQIRELMKVDGLTNDEVKSHLQKYRLHTRRPSPSPQAVGAPAQHLVVVGGIWVPSEYTTAAAYGGGQALYHQPSPHHHTPNHHFCAAASPVPPQDFYAPPMPPPVPALSPLSHHQQHHQLHLHNQQMLVYDKPTSQGRSSPESDIRGGGGDRSESIEDGKSESSSWKGESGAENGYGGERKGLAALREDGEESNGSEITLKF